MLRSVTVISKSLAVFEDKISISSKLAVAFFDDKRYNDKKWRCGYESSH